MSNLFDRYLEQFTVMETLVSQLNSTRNSLSETWANMGILVISRGMAEYGQGFF